MFEHKSPILLVCLALTVNPSRFKKEKGNKFFCCLVCIMPEGLHCLGWKGTLIGSEGLGRDCQGKHYGFSKDELRDSYTKLNAKKRVGCEPEIKYIIQFTQNIHLNLTVYQALCKALVMWQ